MDVLFLLAYFTVCFALPSRCLSIENINGAEYLDSARRTLNAIELNAQDFMFYSCYFRCLEITSMTSYLCSCDIQCLVYKTCCEDFEDACPRNFALGMATFGHMLDLQIRCLDLANVLAIASCPEHACLADPVVNNSSVSNSLNSIPYSDLRTNLVYANLETFQCNVENRSNAEGRWKTGYVLKRLADEQLISTFENYIFQAKSHTPPLDYSGLVYCESATVSLCNNSMFLQRRCQSFVPYLLLKHIVSNFSVCGECRVDLSQLLRLFSKDRPDFEVNWLYTDLGNVHLEFISKPFREVQCNISGDDLLAEPVCRIISCNQVAGFYFQTGTCRKFTALTLAFPNTLWVLGKQEQNALSSYVSFFVRRVLGLEIIDPDVEIFVHIDNVNYERIPMFTLVLDFATVPNEDVLFFEHARELSSLAFDLRTLINHTVQTKSLSHHNVSLIYYSVFKQWLAEQFNATEHRYSTLVQICPVSNYQNEPALIEIINMSSSGNTICLDKVFPSRESEQCFFIPSIKLICYDEASQIGFSQSTGNSILALSRIRRSLFILTLLGLFF
ncbi:carbohydrate sulfotransferase [Biomphalaria glabrata]|nr:hypothetical protein BgiMline_019529 [Biomphalaria glabrata]